MSRCRRFARAHAFKSLSSLQIEEKQMFDAERRRLAACFIECALAGLRGVMLVEEVKAKFPAATERDLRWASFIAVTRADVDEKAVAPIYEVGVSLSPRAESE